MNNYIPYSKQKISNNDIRSVVKVMKSELLTQGPLVKILENKFTKLTNSKFSVCVNSATSALHVACMALGFKKMTFFDYSKYFCSIIKLRTAPWWKS